MQKDHVHLSKQLFWRKDSAKCTVDFPAVERGLKPAGEGCGKRRIAYISQYACSVTYKISASTCRVTPSFELFLHFLFSRASRLPNLPDDKNENYNIYLAKEQHKRLTALSNTRSITTSKSGACVNLNPRNKCSDIQM